MASYRERVVLIVDMLDRIEVLMDYHLTFADLAELSPSDSDYTRSALIKEIASMLRDGARQEREFRREEKRKEREAKAAAKPAKAEAVSQ